MEDCVPVKSELAPDIPAGGLTVHVHVVAAAGKFMLDNTILKLPALHIVSLDGVAWGFGVDE